MCLIDDERVISFELWVALRLGQQDAICHQLNGSGVAGLISKAHLVTHILTNGRSKLLGDPLGSSGGSNPSWLGMANEFATVDRATP